MKIGFDAKRAVENSTGLGNYSRCVIEAISRRFAQSRCLLFAPRKKENRQMLEIAARENVSLIYPRRFFYRLFPSLWRLFGIKGDLDGVEIYHGLSNELPIGIEKIGVKTVVTIHDLIFLRCPQYYRFFDRLIYRAKFKRACEKADAIVAISERTKSEIVSFFHIKPERIEVVYQSCDWRFSEAVCAEEKEKTAQKYKLPDRFMLFVGTIEPRKNLLLAAKALLRLPCEIHLVAVGRKTAYQTQVERFAEENAIADRVHIKNDVLFDDLRAIYQLAAVFVYPSFIEGFGLPIVEALLSRVPVIAAKGLEEAGGEGAVYIDPHSDEELASAAAEFLSVPESADRAIEAGLRHTQLFDGEAAAEKMMDLYVKVLQTPRGEAQ
ncbi:MAG: glycosyltransferase family 4 protein [Helicobacteraceae bacterium]|jgi:glycosyltransferase involved in cell wall biosynthesis|nr:glycosyltransferase family 4 protein [Helicobacteraceae bacterium]